MNSSQNTDRLTGLPPEILLTICNFLPPEEKMLTVAKISKIFFEITEKNPQHFYHEFIRVVLKDEIKECNYNEVQINFILSLVKNNNFISFIRKNTFTFEFQNASFLRYKTQVIMHHKEPVALVNHAKYEDYRLISNNLKISWNPNNPIFLSTGEKKYGNFRSSYAVEVLVDKFIIAKNHLNLFETESINHFRLNGEAFGPNQEAGFFKWSRCREVKPLQMDILIKHALSLQLRMFTAFFTYLNMNTLSLIEQKEFESDSFRKSYDCDQNGIIKPNGHLKFLFTIKKRIIEQGIPVLFWESNDYCEVESACDASHFLRWSVFSATTEQFAKKMGIQIEHFKIKV